MKEFNRKFRKHFSWLLFWGCNMTEKELTVRLTFAMLLTAFVLLLVLAAGTRETEGKTITVDDSGGADYEKIQDAIDASEDGDTVKVYEGQYEENVVVDKKIDLIGNGSETTTVDGGGSGDVVAVSSDWVNLTGFAVSNGGDAGIELDTVQYCTLQNNSCNESITGIKLLDCSNNVIQNNTCLRNDDHGIHLDSSSSNRIRLNNCSRNQGQGIYLIIVKRKSRATNL